MDISLRWTVRLMVFALLSSSLLVALLLHNHPLAAAWPAIWAFLPPLTFSAFVVVFAIDRLIAVRSRGYPAPQAMFQVGTALVVLTLLWPRGEQLAVLGPRAGAPNLATSQLEPAQLLLRHGDPQVRAATCALLCGELLGVPHPLPPGHPLEALHPMLEQLAESDPEPRVRHHCSEALSQLPPADPALLETPASGSAEEEDEDDCDPEEEPLDDDLTTQET